MNHGSKSKTHIEKQLHIDSKKASKKIDSEMGGLCIQERTGGQQVKVEGELELENHCAVIIVKVGSSKSDQWTLKSKGEEFY